MLIGKNYWNKIAKGYSKTGGSKWIRHPWTIRFAGEVSDKKVLELGCGTGTIINNLVKKGAIGTGIDYSEMMLDEARAEAKRMMVKTNFARLDIRDLSTFYKKKFDLIIISAVLVTFSSVTTIIKILSEAKKVLADNGTILLAEPHPAFDHYMRAFLKNPEEVKKLNYQAKGNQYIFDMVDEKDNKVESVIYHWRLEDYSLAIYNSGLYIERLFEPRPVDVSKNDKEWYEKRSPYPSYIFIKLKKIIK